MCRIDDCDPCDWFGTVERTARKPHACGECGRDIAPGEHYKVSSYVMDGQFFTNKACAHCAVARTWLEKHCGGWVTEALLEELQEHWDESESYRKQDRLGRLLVGVRRGWAGFRGGLMPIPKPCNGGGGG